VSTFPIEQQEARRVEWAALAALGIMWAAFLVPTPGRRRSAHRSVDEFERGLELLAYSEVHGTEGRWIVTPRKGARFVGNAQRQRARARDRRRRVFVILLEAIVLTGLIGAVPPLRAMWSATLVLGVLLVLYVWLLLSMKARSSGPVLHETARAIARPERAPRAAKPRHVADGAMGWARPTFNGLVGIGEGDDVHVVVKPASAAV
jgi:Flp pilus assembly protein TadB